MRYLISAPVAFLSLILVLLLMAQLIQPNVSTPDYLNKLTPIDFFRTPPVNTTNKATQTKPKNKTIQNEAPELAPPYHTRFRFTSKHAKN